MISETKIDESFLVYQFKIDGFNTPFQVDRDQKGSGIMFYFREDLPAKLLSIVVELQNNSRLFCSVKSEAYKVVNKLLVQPKQK